MTIRFKNDLARAYQHVRVAGDAKIILRSRRDAARKSATTVGRRRSTKTSWIIGTSDLLNVVGRLIALDASG